MNTLISIFKSAARILLRFYKLFTCSLYDMLRFVRFSGWKNNNKDSIERNYRQVMFYHGLEKSMSFSKRKKGSGKENARKITDLLKSAKKHGNYGFHDYGSSSVIEKFLAESINNDNEFEVIKNEFQKVKVNTELDAGHGVVSRKKSDFTRGVLPKPSDFFESRYSLREFSDEAPSQEKITQAIELALKTPSVCNRHAWHIYKSNQESTIQSALEIQNGNRGFGCNIKNLLVVTSDLKSFFAGEERNQCWIDGGMFAMSIVYAFHSLGVASCCLNWSQSAANDKLFRKKLNIQKNHNIIMLIAFGYPKENNLVCSSIRRPTNSFITDLKQL